MREATPFQPRGVRPTLEAMDTPKPSLGDDPIAHIRVNYGEGGARLQVVEVVLVLFAPLLPVALYASIFDGSDRMQPYRPRPSPL